MSLSTWCNSHQEGELSDAATPASLYKASITDVLLPIYLLAMRLFPISPLSNCLLPHGKCESLQC